MTKLEKQTLADMKTVAYWSCLGVVEIKEVVHGVEDYLYCVAGTCTEKHRSYHRLLVKYSNSRGPYVVLYGLRLFLQDAIRL